MSATKNKREIISVYRGYGLILELLVQRDCAKVNLTDAQLHMQVFDSNSHPLFKVYSKDINADGQATIILYPWQTDLPVGEYVIDIKLYESNGMVNTIFPAKIGNTGILRIAAL